MTPEAIKVLDDLRQNLKLASIAQIGGFRPPDDPCSSWFGRGVCRPDEGLPEYDGKPMLPLLQINVSELPFVPPQLHDVSLLVLFFQHDDYPFDKPHGEGWLIREYISLEGLQPLPVSDLPPLAKPFPIKWSLIEDDAPSWEDCWSVIEGIDFVNDDHEANNAFYEDFHRFHQTKVGGYPYCIQHEALKRNTEFVFQVGSEEKAQWMWIDHGIGCFYKDSAGKWSWACQFY